MTNEAGLEFENVEPQCKAALDALDKIEYATGLGGLKTSRTFFSGEKLVVTLDEVKAIRAALSSPAVPVIPGLEEAINYINNGKLEYKKLSEITMGNERLDENQKWSPGCLEENQEWYPVNEKLIARVFDASRAYAAQPKMQKVDLGEMILQLPYDEIEQRYINCYLSNERVRGYNVALDDIKAKYGELYAEVKE